MYLEISLAFPGYPGINITDNLLLSILRASLDQLHGLVGLHSSNTNNDQSGQLDKKESNAIAVIKLCDKRDLNKVWNACTFMTCYDDHACRLQVLRTSPTNLKASVVNQLEVEEA
ncbi:hypothetical protein CEUSTIGMA_g4601.t1 [Chlamydomonas eustigma]|uniref:Uncharacterized protein n=1 Tax=Chlamydomonas eustigma TaxID=1157962 RepID=A0A250X278_9CHLO|nr:hypothetical protein CEUSTIGMA_g4601.t1 [Chlamydomonas eustigma]|eukprot:GAX77156.1 hypothetical protein CEUSTIGMA_g4601.t1 [Chlamydomonas eustigma]